MSHNSSLISSKSERYWFCVYSDAEIQFKLEIFVFVVEPPFVQVSIETEKYEDQLWEMSSLFVWQLNSGGYVDIEKATGEHRG